MHLLTAHVRSFATSSSVGVVPTRHGERKYCD